MTDTILDRLHDEFGWPADEVIFNPSGETAAIFARLAKQKIGQGLQHLIGLDGVDVGVLVRNPENSGSDVPLAVVCRFSSPAAPAFVAEAHRLAWNFCHAPLLITIDPVELRAWSCFVAPSLTMGALDAAPASLDIGCHVNDDLSSADHAANALHWVSLIAGEPERLRPELFDPSGRADRLLLENLKEVRRKLISGEDALPVDQAHDLIARLMFIQFLFDRRDSSGYAALNADSLQSLVDEGYLQRTHASLHEILTDYDESYRLFQWLNERFNGDLFPGKSTDPDEREHEWRREMDIVKPQHLAILADLVSGQLLVETGQFAMWRLYSFDTIPLEFVSSIYEEFVSARKEPKSTRKGSPKGRKFGSAHYTPAHLADYILDAVLPWHGDEWRIRILDPSCGSGIFLVRAFQRLVHRWRKQNQSEEIPVKVLQELLTQYLCGVDLNGQAVRVASFSLYLAMCDEIEPRRYWSEVRFPRLRDNTLISKDFFLTGRIDAFEEPFDIVIGNAPWGANTVTAPAKEWADNRNVRVDNKDVGPLFLLAGAEWLRPGGRLAMIQSVKSVLTGARSGVLRSLLAANYQIEEVTNFTLLRFNLFRDATSPACSIVLCDKAPNGEPTTYICPKRSRSSEDDYRIAFDHLDVNYIYAEELADPLVWNVLVTGGRRDIALVRKIIRTNKALHQIDGASDLVMSEGVIIGDESTKPDHLRDRRVLLDGNFPAETDGELNASQLPRMKELAVERGRTGEVFETPQLLIKQGWDRQRMRFSSALVVGREGVVCSQSYVSVHAKTKDAAHALASIRDSVNSPVMSYYFGMTNGRMTYRPELLVRDILSLPVFSDGAGFKDFKEPERALIEDALTFAIPELLKADSPSAWSTTERQEGGIVEAFCDYYLRVLTPNGKTAGPNATIYREIEGTQLPVRMVAIHLAPIDDRRIRYEDIGSGRLRARLLELHSILAGKSDGGQASRVATVYDTRPHPTTGQPVPTVYLIRPDRSRFWSRSIALREADRLIAERISRTALARDGGVVEK